MTKILHSISLAAGIVALSAVGALAQTNSGNTAGSAGSPTATKSYPTGQGNPALAPGRSSQSSGGVADAHDPTVPGATGHTVVPGNNSTIQSGRTGTREQRTGQIQSPGGGAGGGGGGAGGGGGR